MLAVALVLLAVPVDSDEIPLQAIGTKRVEAPPAKSPPKPVRRAPIGLLVGPKIGGQFGLSSPLGGSVLAGIEVGYRLPVLSRVLGLSVELTFANPGARRDSVLGSERTSSLWLSVPIYASASFDLGAGLLRVLAGPAFEYWQARSTVEGSGFRFDDTAWSLGAAGILSYGFVLGPGALAIELRYRFGLPHMAGEPQTMHSLGVTAGYLFIL